MGSQIVSWLDNKIKLASNEGNYEDWSNYTKLLELYKNRLENNNAN